MAGTPTGGNVYSQAATGLQSGLNTAMGVAGYSPANVGAYMSPFISSVVNPAMADLDRARQMSMNQLGAQASQAGAFGGSRHGVAEAQTNDAFMEQAGQLSANLYNQGFSQAQQAMNADMQTKLAAAGMMGNLSNLGFGMGQAVTGQQAMMGAQQQAMMQALIDAAKGQFNAYTGSPMSSVAGPLGAVAGVPSGQTQTTMQQPGLFNFMSLLLGGL